MKRLIFLAAAIILLGSNCKKNTHITPPDNPYGLPNATQTGKNIFACRVNGENWISKKGIYNMGGSHSGDTISITGKITSSQLYYERITVRVDGNTVVGNTNTIASNSSGKIFFQGNRNCLCPNGGCDVFTIYATSGDIIITNIDTQRKIVSGKFECKIPMPQCDTLIITDGRFDILYY